MNEKRRVFKPIMRFPPAATLRAAIGMLVFGILPVASWTVVGAETPDNAGQRIYREGILPTGRLVGGTVQRDVPLTGDQLACASCHGRSGLGSREGATMTPAIAGSILYQPEEIRRKELYASKLIRPAYTDESLARAIRTGVDANGEPLDALMPRYALSDADTEILVAYIKSLSANISPGVTNEEIHFATVIVADIPDDRQGAMLDVLTAFVESKNAATRQETQRAEHSPFHKEWKYQAYRKWKLHVWELSGPQDQWSGQLDHYYAEQPVFAMISGIGNGSWQPVHEFCETHRVPCVLPITDLPGAGASDYYSLYFSQGMTLQAAVVAKHVSESKENIGRIVQLHRGDQRAVTAARELRRRLDANEFQDVVEVLVPEGERTPQAFWQSLAESGQTYSLVLWLEENSADALGAIAELENSPQVIYLATTEIDAAFAAVPASIRSKIRFLYPFDLPQDAAGRLKRADIWMRNQNVAVTDYRLQANVLFTGMLVSQALKHAGSNFYRDYFLEKIEHTLDGMSSLAAYPNLSLARNQRFASKGCYIASIGEGPEGESVLEGDWVVPD